MIEGSSYSAQLRNSDPLFTIITIAFAIVGLALIIVITLVIVQDIKWQSYESKLEYIGRYATVIKIDREKHFDSLVPLNIGNNIFIFNHTEGHTSAEVTYEDESGEHFSEYFSDDTTLVVGDKVIISVGYDDGRETDYIKFVERVE